MNHHDREFFIYKIRSGKVFLKNRILIKPPSVDLSVESCLVYEKAYEEAFDDEVMTESEMLDWMIEHDLWGEENETKIEGLKKDLERLKEEIYNNRNNPEMVSQIRQYLRAGEKQLKQQLDIKGSYYQNTCEGVAQVEKISFLIENSTYKNNKLYQFDDGDTTVQDAMTAWYADVIHDSTCRELARNDPWKTIWAINERSGQKLFSNKEDEELTYNQKSLLMWSQMYDNIQESMECPSNDVINDDDMLDGWFIIQSKKRDREKVEKEFEGSASDRIKNSDEVFVMSHSNKQTQSIEAINNPLVQQIKKQREAVIKKKGVAEQHDFADERLKARNKQTQAFKDKF
jgi:muconolactone delta-isomerase